MDPIIKIDALNSLRAIFEINLYRIWRNRTVSDWYKLKERYPGAMNDNLHNRLRQPEKNGLRIYTEDYTLHAEWGDPYGRKPKKKDEKTGLKGAVFVADRNHVSATFRIRLPF